MPIEQAILRKSKTPQKSPGEWTFLSLAFHNAPSLHTVNKLPCETKKSTSELLQECSQNELEPKRQNSYIT